MDGQLERLLELSTAGGKASQARPELLCLFKRVVERGKAAAIQAMLDDVERSRQGK